MKTIHKYTLAVVDFQTLRLPRGAELLTAQAQGDHPQLWARVDLDEAELEAVELRTVGTGRPFPDSDDWGYVGTYQLQDGALVFHLFRRAR